MRDTKILVDDTLLRELSLETRKIGSKVLVHRTENSPEYMADIMDVIVLPQAEFYRTKFMAFYKIYNHNSVKALKELNNHFTFIPDFELGIGYVLNVDFENDDPSTSNSIKVKQELKWFQNASFSDKVISETNP